MDTVSTFFRLGKSGEGLSFEFLCGKMNSFLDIIKGVIKTTGKAGIFLLRHSLTVQAKRNVLYTWDGEQEKSHT